ncbi:phenylalanine--tRNA ligase subunit beta [Puccinia graminis f. sp. tritici]|uniref:phenylalanine--tRNA ligase n=1 Tax=Puccinia graminis f. sp. tritici TaxID=56615 RepID=A0A5B0QYE0_PUCGR|nr:phenylalanine--tRNA ligase subunit beta [Puccinia graminis f. sp. tritici]
MPTITVDKERFFKELGKTFKDDKEFDGILFDYGLELDEDTEHTTPEEKPYKLKIEVPANRYDLLCHQGLILALRTYIGTQPAPNYSLIIPPPEQQWKAYVRKETSQIRPFFASAILRGVQFDEQRYKDFIELQDKLHGNLCRKRTLVAIGTHDLSTIDHTNKVISYEARPPKEIKFAPLNKETEYDATQLMTLYESDKHLSKYLHIIRDSPLYPIIYDNSRTVLSMPPIINSNKTKITLDTRDVFIDVTATDQTKLGIVINMIITMFSQYCSKPFTVEPVDIIYEHDLAESYRSPKIEPLVFATRQSYINSVTGLNLTREAMIELLEKMGHRASIGRLADGLAINSSTSLALQQAPPEDLLSVSVPPTRPDILHECDLVEEVAIAYGFNHLAKTFPSTNTVAKPYPINKLSDLVRKECAFAGWLEVLPLTLCSHDENFKFLRKEDNGSEAVVLSNPATIEFQVVRTSLLPGLLKTIRENRKHSLPMKIFEVSDVVIKDASLERKAKNLRRLGAVYVGKKSAGFEVVHGLLDRVMATLEIDWIGLGPDPARKSLSRGQYRIEESDHPTFFNGRSAKILFKPTPQVPLNQDDLEKRNGVGHDWIQIGWLGILHPIVIKNFELDFPCSCLEFNLSPFL